MPINVTTRTEVRAKGARQLVLQAGDTIEFKKNGVVVEDFTVPANKTATGFIAIDFTIT